MPIIGDIIRNLQIAIDAFWYQLLMTLAAFQWSLLRGAFMMGYTIQLLTDWLASRAFAPLIQQTGDSLRVATSWTFVIALLVLGITYLLASIVRLDVVSPRNAILWFFTGSVFFQIGPALYQGMSDFRRTVSAAFYLSVLDSMRGTAGGALVSLNEVQTSDLGMFTPCDNFGPYLGRPGGHGAPIVINGLDVALAYLRADGIDVMGYAYPTSDNCQAHFPPQSYPLPWEWNRPGSFFDLTTSPVYFPEMASEERAGVLALASSAQWRLFSAWGLVWFGIFEQIVSLCLTIAQGITFIAFACAVLFAFFKRTEGIAWSLVDQWLELIVQTVILAMVQALVVSFFLAAIAANNGLVAMGVGLVCLVLMGILLWSGVRAIWRSLNRLFDAFGKATGGVVVTVGAAAGTAASVGAGTAASGMSLAGNTLGGASALMQGASWAQAAGVALGGSQMLTGAARTLSHLPGLRDTPLAEAADHFVEGAVTRQVVRGVPGVGRVAGPVVGAALLTDRDPAHAEQGEYGYAHPPMLVPAVGRTLAGFTRGPGWEVPETPLEGEFTPLQSERKGKFTPAILEDDPSVEPTVTPASPAPNSTPELRAQLHAASEREEQVEQETGEELEQHFSQIAGGNQSPDSGMANAALRLEGAGSRLERAADRLDGAVRQGQPSSATSTATIGANPPTVITSDTAMAGSETLVSMNSDPVLMKEDEG